MTTDLELTTKAAQTAAQLVVDLQALGASTTPAIVCMAAAETHWAGVLARRTALMAELATHNAQTEGIEDIIAASHKFGEQG